MQTSSLLPTLQLPDFTLPPLVARINRHLPRRPLSLALVTALNLALDRLLPREPLQPLQGRRLELAVSDAGIRVALMLDGRRFVTAGFDAPDLVITARARDYLALLLREEDADTLFFSRRLLMEGDTELGLLVKNTLDAVEPPAAFTSLLNAAQAALARLAAARHTTRIP